MSGEAPESGDKVREAGPRPPDHSITPSHGVHINLKFLEQLKRRNVGRIAILYIIVCYLILEPFGLFVHVLALPEWVGRAVVVLMVLGFPVALIVAWVFEVTPQGLKPTAEVDPRQSMTKLTGRRLDIAIIVVLAIALAYFAVDKFWLSKRLSIERPAIPVAATASGSAPAAPAMPEKSIAVLPFTDMSEKKDQEYFADGMAEEILDLLAKIPDLTVIGRTSSFQFKGKNADLRTIGTQLNAAYVLEGSIRKSGGQVRITAQLINTRTGTHEWSETYDRQIGEVLKLQDAVAAAVVRELQLTVAPDYVQSHSTLKNAESYDLYLRGRHAYDRYDSAGLDEAATLFQRALDHDPSFTDAAVWLAWTRILQGQFYFLAATDAFEQARHAATIALKLDPKSAGAHAALASVHTMYDWDWVAAELEIKQSATLAPGSMDALFVKRMLAITFGRWDDALRHIKAAIAQDPLDPETFFALSNIQQIRGHLPEAEGAMRRTLDIRPTFSYAHYYLGLILLARGDRPAALREMQQEATDEGKQQGLSIVYYALGRKAESDAALADMIRDQANLNAVGIAEVYAFRGQPDDALHWLERAYAQKDPELFSIKLETELKSLNADPRFKAFLRKMNLPE